MEFQPPLTQQAAATLADFRCHTGQILPELKSHYRTLGDPSNPAVMVLHGTMGSGASLLVPEFAGQLFGNDQPLDSSKYFIILPDAIGTGQSSKPSDALGCDFPNYSYDDMVQAHVRLLTEHLKIAKLHLLLGYSMGGMVAWLWAQQHPQMVVNMVTLASSPAAMGGRNWMLRRMLIDNIKRDPDWHGGRYTQQPRSAQFASVFYAVASNGGNQALMHAAPHALAGEARLDAALTAVYTIDANDLIYQWAASRDYDPAPGLHRITARVLAINSADDERNPPELGVLNAVIPTLKHGRSHLVPASSQTCGHSTVMHAHHWVAALSDFLAEKNS